MVSAVLGFVVQLSLQAFQDESSDFIRSKVKALFQRSRVQTPETRALQFSKEQLRQAHQVALQEAIRYGMDQVEAERMADALLRLFQIKNDSIG